VPGLDFVGLKFKYLVTLVDLLYLYMGNFLEYFYMVKFFTLIWLDESLNLLQ